jgi:multicomponent Na+:H+ antiporter subunit D
VSTPTICGRSPADPVDALVPLPVAIPLLAAALLAALNFLHNRTFADVIGLLAAGASTAICAILVARSIDHGPLVYWFGGWRPHAGVALGVSFAVDTLGAGMATLAALLVTAALVYSARYFEPVGHLFHALMLVFLAAMVGFCLTGDLFNMFVWFELMSGAAYALTAYKVEDRGPIQGAINFAATNSVGGFMILTGIALLYGRTGALNLAQLGQALASHQSDMLVVAALALILVGFLVKAAVVPLHFWLADAQAVAPTPVCVVFSGVMVQLGLFGVARVYWTVFQSPLEPHLAALRDILIWLGVVSAIVGAVMCFSQHHLKRLLAFSTVSHSGLFLIGIALVSHLALAGTAMYVLAHGLAKAALFMAVGVLLHRFASMDEFELHGQGRSLWPIAFVLVAGGLVLSAAPMFGSFFGKSMIDEASLEQGYGWLPALFLVCSAITGAAVLRVAGRVFAGWGSAEHPDDASEAEASHEHVETDEANDHTPLPMAATPLVLVVAAIVIGLVPGVVHEIEHAAEQFVDRGSYVTAVLGGGHPHFAESPPSKLEPFDFLYGAGATLLAIGLAALALFGHPLLRRVPGPLRGRAIGALSGLRTLHSGRVGDYIAWFTFGLATLGGLFALTLR